MKTITKFTDLHHFETSRLIARKLKPTDFNTVLPLYENSQVMATLGGTLTTDEIKERFQRGVNHWEKHGFGQWLWFDKVSGKLAGRAGLRELEIMGKQVIEIGYALMPEFWGQGLATEIAMACIEIAFEVLQLEKLVCFTQASNQASKNVMQKAGFQFDCEFVYANEPHVLYRLNNPLKNNEI